MDVFAHKSARISALMTVHCQKILILMATVVLTGCAQDRPAPVAVVQWNASTLTAAAFAKLDANKNNQLDADELTPGLKAALPKADSDKNGSLTKAELEARLKAHLEFNAGMQSTAGILTLDGQPALGVKVTLEPEPFMSEVCKPASGITDNTGTFTLKTDGMPLPGALPGIYSVKLEKEGDTIPEKYNTKTTLGFEVAGDLPSQLMLDLTR